MSIWQHYNYDEKLVMLQQTAAAKKIVEQAVEKDWWVSAILMALTKTSWADFLQFKDKTHYPATIQICPPEHLISSWKDDYERLRESFIYDETKKTFEELTERMLELTNRMRNIKL